MRSVFLVGFMASGKTTVGRLVAQATGLPFVDLDQVIVASQGRSIPEIFAAEGEAGFRRHEKAALGKIVAGSSAVVATGGGAPVDEDNLAAMRRRGLVVALGASLDNVLARAREPADRPLLDRPAAEVASLFRAREPVYRRAHAALDTDGLTPAEVAGRVVELVQRAAMFADSELADAALVALGERSYPVLVASGVLGRAGELVAAALPGVRRVALVSDSIVAPLHGARVVAALTAAGLEVSLHTVPAGETAKTGDSYLSLADGLIAAGLDRASAVVGLGGGVVGDLCGFVAATLFRGVPVVHLPTSLVAMIDSAIGGKTGINTPAGKNLVGAFWQPVLVAADPEVLGTLPARELRAALGELIKYALLDGERMYAEVERLAVTWAGEATAADQAAIVPLIGRSVAIKAAIVSRDERERRGERQLLNLGLTVGHAIEVAAGYGVVHHGEAVALGLIAACRVSAALGRADVALEARVTDTVASAGLPADLAPWLRPEVLERIKVDKKRSGQDVAFVTVGSPGDCSISPIAVDRLTQILAVARPL